jgi:hypothetical protein
MKAKLEARGGVSCVERGRMVGKSSRGGDALAAQTTTRSRTLVIDIDV